MENQSFEAGDTVQLKSGSLTMTIGAFKQHPGHSKTAFCYYFQGQSNEIKTIEIYVEALKKVAMK